MDNKEITFPGALEDTRPEEAKAKDWHKEIDLAMAGPVEWKEKTFENIKTFPVRNQDGSSSCVAQTLALMMGIENFFEEGKFIEFSAKDIYTRRSNNSGGMIGVEAFEIIRKYGTTLESLIPSQNMNETDINKISRKVSDEQIAEIFKIKDYNQLGFNIEKIAFIMEGGRKNSVAKPVMTWYQFPRVEWDSKPEVGQSNNDLVRHSVTGVDYGMMNGVKGLFTQDSWGLHSSTTNGLRFISENYIKSRMIFCAFMNDLENDWQDKEEEIIVPDKPVLRKGAKGDDVKELQRILKIVVDGDFGPKTLQAVKDFQKSRGLLADGIVGRKTWIELYK